MSVFAVPRRRRTCVLLALCLMLVFAADLLLYGQTLGWTLGLFTLLLLIALAVRGLAASCATLIVLAATVGLAAAMVLSPNWRAVLLALLGLLSLAILARQGPPRRAFHWLAYWLPFPLAGAFRPFQDVILAFRRSALRRIPPSRLHRWLLVWLIPLAFAVIFIRLFSVANPIIDRWLTHIADTISRWLDCLANLADGRRAAFWLAVAASCWALLRVRTRRYEPSPARLNSLDPALDVLFTARAIIASLLVFNALFAIQTLMDLLYLWGGLRLPEGLTYAQYAHHGAYPLVATALLAGFFVLLTFRPHSPAESSRSARWLVYLWVAQNILLTISAICRLKLYVDAFTLTRWRLAAAVWLLLVAIGLIWVVLRLARRASNEWLIRANAWTLIAVLYLSAFADFDRLIAWHNVAHCREAGGAGVPIDLDYLGRLGPQALPALDWLLIHSQDDRLQREGGCLEHDLACRLEHDLSDWRSWTVRRWQIRHFADLPNHHVAKSTTDHPLGDPRGTTD